MPGLGLGEGGWPSARLLLVCSSCWARIPKGATFEGPLATRGETKPKSVWERTRARTQSVSASPHCLALTTQSHHTPRFTLPIRPEALAPPKERSTALS